MLPATLGRWRKEGGTCSGMKPKQLKYPFPWEERRVLLQGGILYVPDYMQDYRMFSFPDWQDVFGNSNPIHIEYCSGNGTWIAERAQENPTQNWVAVEMKFDRVRKIWSKVQNLQLSNLFIVCGEALTATRYFFSSASVDEVYINFPDPWPKKKHAKNRLLKGSFIEELWRIFHDDGRLTLVTDDVPYSEQVIAEVLEHGGFKSDYPQPYYVDVPDCYGDSYFDSLWRELGRKIRYHQFRKKEAFCLKSSTSTIKTLETMFS